MRNNKSKYDLFYFKTSKERINVKIRSWVGTESGVSLVALAVEHVWGTGALLDDVPAAADLQLVLLRGCCPAGVARSVGVHTAPKQLVPHCQSLPIESTGPAGVTGPAAGCTLKAGVHLANKRIRPSVEPCQAVEKVYL